MRGRLFGLLLCAAATPSLAVAVADPVTANAARVLVMEPGGHVSVRNDPFLPQPALTPAPASVGQLTHGARAGGSPARSGARAAKAKKPARTVRGELTRLYHAGEITQAQYRSYGAGYTAALATVKRLKGTRARELDAVIANVSEIAAAGGFIPSRLPVLFLTLNNNRQWWSTAPIPAPGASIEFAGSQLAWEYYAGQGIELQVLATFGRADGMYTAGPSEYPQLQQLISEMVPLATDRAGGLTWEYFFHWEGGNAPWTSAMSQGTGIEALTRAALAFGHGTQGYGGASAKAPPAGSQPDAQYLQLAQEALPVFTVAPPTGVRIPTAIGARYVQYSFTPGTDIINAFLQSLIGLYDYAQVSHNPEAQQLFAAGNAQAEAEVPRFDTGAWSLYQPGVEDPLSYHELVTGFLQALCTRTGAPVYCTTAQHFESYLTTPPVLQQLTSTASARTPFTVRFRLSKISHVGIVITLGNSTALATSATFPYGVNGFHAPALRAGTYGLRLAATDLAGNFSRITGTLVVSAPKHAHK